MARFFLLVSFLCCVLRLSADGINSEKTYDLNDTSKVYDIDEVVIVSSPKEVFRLRQQALSSNSLGAKDLSSLGVRDLRELSDYVPNFEMPSYGSRLTSSMYVRGIGSRVNSPAVGIYLDGMPIMSKAAFNFHTYQLDRVDVLRGPQGTLYGLNTEGGLVRLFTRDPLQAEGTDLRFGYGSHNWRLAEIAHYQKLSEKLAIGLAGFYQGSDGFFKYKSSGLKADNGNEAGGRLRVAYRPSDNFSLSYVADYQYTRQNAFPYGVMDRNTGETAAPDNNYRGNYRRNMFNTALDLGWHVNAFDFHSITSYQYLKDYMLMDQDYLPQDFMHLEQRQFQNAFTQEFSIKSREPLSGFWHWAFGAFFSSQWLRTEAPVYFDSDFTDNIASGIQSSIYNAVYQSMISSMVAQGMPQAMAEAMAAQAIEAAGGVNMQVALTVPGVYHTPQLNLGVFHESNFAITPRLTASVGLRYDYTHTKVRYETSALMSLSAHIMGQSADNLLSSVLDGKGSDSFNQLLPKFSLRYSLDNAGSNVYAMVSKGYRAGGFNIQMFSDILQTELNEHRQDAMKGDYDVPHTAEDYRRINETIAYKPETSWNFELGAHLNLFQQKLHWDMAAFYMRIQDQQLSVMAGNYGYGRMMVNAGRSHSCGLETTLRGAALDSHFNWGLTYGYTRAVFDEYEDKDTAGNPVSYKDRYVPYVPQHTLSVQADYRWDFSRSLLRSLTFGLRLNAQGKTYWDENNDYSQPFYALLGAQVDADFGFVGVSLWAKNLTKTRYNTFALQSAATGTAYCFAQQGNPFHCGVDIQFHF